MLAWCLINSAVLTKQCGMARAGLIIRVMVATWHAFQSCAQYIKQYGDKLDGATFFAMHLLGDGREIPDVFNGRPRDITVSAWIKQCW